MEKKSAGLVTKPVQSVDFHERKIQQQLSCSYCMFASLLQLWQHPDSPLPDFEQCFPCRLNVLGHLQASWEQ
jgi:hypothetical protein